MPLPMVHLSVAKEIKDVGFELQDLSLFYLGSISPDAIHMRKEADRFAKNETHLIPTGKKWADIDEIEYFDFIFDYISSNKNRVDADFLWGYGIHILTDMYWTKHIYKKFVEDYKKDSAPIQDERWAYYNDTDILDQVLFNECSWKNDVWQNLQAVEYFDFMELLSAQEIKSWNERTLHWYDSGESQHKSPIKYISKSDIEKFITSCAETIWDCIKKREEYRL